MRVIPVAKPILGRREARAVARVVRSGSLAQGKYVTKFEQEFSKLVSGRECVAVNSGTSALHVALLSIGVGSGDEVIVPSFTFAATANSVRLCGATPVFVDICPRTFNMHVDAIRAAITPKTKAIQVVHLFGLPADMNSIMKVAQEHNLLVVEDAAQAHMAAIDGHRVGTFGDAAAFSFYPTKNMTSGEGGMAVFRREQDARMARLLRNQGMEKRYHNEVIGMNLRMTEIHAVIGLEQIKKLSTWTLKRQENASFLSAHLEGVVTPYVPQGFEHVYHQYTIRCGNRDWLMDSLRKSGIGCDIYYPTQVHKLPSFNEELTLPETEMATKEVLSIPVHPSLSKRDLIYISRAVNRLVGDHR